MKLQWKNEFGESGYKYYILKRQTPTLRPFLDEHSHDYAEIVYVERGDFTHYVNGSNIKSKKGDILFIPPDDAVHKFKDYDNNISLLQILFPMASFAFIKGRYNIPEWESLWYPSDNSPFNLKLTQQQWFENSFNRLMVSNNSLFEIERFLLNMISIICDSRISQSGSASECWLDRALKEIQEPKNFKLGVQGFTSLCSKSHEHVEREVKKKTNQTITDVVNKARMNWASYMLIYSDVEIMDIADGCGFNSISYFYKLFHDFFSVSPSKYRKNSRDFSQVDPNQDFKHYMEKIP